MSPDEPDPLRLRTIPTDRSPSPRRATWIVLLVVLVTGSAAAAVAWRIADVAAEAKRTEAVESVLRSIERDTDDLVVSMSGTSALVQADGTITQFPLSDDAFPQEIAAGPDGNVWFTNSASAIDRISPTGTPLPGYTVEGVVGLLAPGPDGALWFTRTGNVKAVGRIVPGGGEPTSFTAGIDQLAGFGGLATGPDGNLWFTQSGTISYGGTTFAGTVNRITPDGVVTTYATGLSPGARPGDIAAGSDGRMWFTDGLGSVAAIGTGAPDASVSRPAVTGSVTVGSTLTCGGDSWSTWAGQQPSRTVFGFDGYRWLRDGAALPDPPSATHVVSVQDLSHALTCSATVTYPLLNVTTLTLMTRVLGVIAALNRSTIWSADSGGAGISALSMMTRCFFARNSQHRRPPPCSWSLVST